MESNSDARRVELQLKQLEETSMVPIAYSMG
jgi:hypothetical protein